MKPVARCTIIFLALVAFGHLLRLIFGITVIAGGVSIPLWASTLACVVTGGLSFKLWRESSR